RGWAGDRAGRNPRVRGALTGATRGRMVRPDMLNVEPGPNSIVAVGAARFGNALPLALIAGPCALESREHALEMAGGRKENAGRPGRRRVFKNAVDKA